MKLPFDVTTTPTYRDMQAAWRIATDVATGRRRMAMLCSDSGYGKTHILKTAMRRANVSWAYCNPDDHHAFITKLWRLTLDRIAIAAMDDVDRGARNETLANLAKNAFGDERRIVQQSVRSMKNEDYRTSDDPKAKAHPAARIRDRPALALAVE